MNGQLTIPQVYMGRVNVVGDCYCLGVALDRRPPTFKALPIYISVAGPATSVEALWARLSQGKETSVIPLDLPALGLDPQGQAKGKPDDTARQTIYLEPNKAGLYKRFQKKIDSLGIDHLILVHEDMAEPGYPTLAAADKEAATTYLLSIGGGEQQAKLLEHVRKTVKISVFDEWAGWIEQAGKSKGLVRDCTGYGIEAVSIRLDTLKWTAAITEGLKNGAIALP